MATIADAPWIAEAERTGFSRYGYFNAPVDVCDSTSCDRCRGLINVGDDYYNVDGQVICEECVDAMFRKWHRRWGE